MTAAYPDTNVLVHLLTGWPEDKASAARAFIEASLERKSELRIPVVVVHETWYVIARRYGLGRRRSAAILADLVDSDDLAVEARTVVAEALSMCAARGVDFVDAYLAETARVDGSSVASFDRDFDMLGVQRIEPGT